MISYDFFSPNDTYDGLHYAFVCSSMLGFIFFDLLYIAVVINYVSQCQLLSFYIENVTDKVENKRYKTLTDASKVNDCYCDFLSVMLCMLDDFRIS